MIELQRDESQDIQVWTDESNTHVIVLETENTCRYGSGGSGWYVRDEVGEVGPYLSFGEAFEMACSRWGQVLEMGTVTLAPANRLVRDIEQGRADEAGHFLLEYLADYGAVGIDAQALALIVFARIGADEEAWR